MVDLTLFTYKIEFEVDEIKKTKYYHKERSVTRRYKKELKRDENCNPVIFFHQNGEWIGLDKVIENVPSKSINK